MSKEPDKLLEEYRYRSEELYGLLFLLLELMEMYNDLESDVEKVEEEQCTSYYFCKDNKAFCMVVHEKDY